MSPKATTETEPETEPTPPEPEPDDDEPAIAWEGSMSSMVPLVAPDGHVNLSQEDIDARDQ